jgi:hypothetical protein
MPDKHKYEPKRYEARRIEFGNWGVWDTQENKWVFKNIPNKKRAEARARSANLAS